MPTTAPADTSDSIQTVVRPSPAWGLLLALATGKLLLHLLSSGPLAYGYFRDELYYLDCADHLAWGYVDQPPFSIAVLWLVRPVLGTSLIAVRIVPMLAGCATLAFTGLIARELGGGRAAQGVAALAAWIAPVYLALGGFYSMNAFDLLFWTLALYLLLRIANGAHPRTWLVLGAVMGFGLLNKISMLWFGFGLGVGLLLTPQRRWLRTRWPWLAAIIAFALFAPHVVWQVQHDWPTLEFMRNATQQKMLRTPPPAFLLEQVLAMHPLAVPLWSAGLVWYFAAPAAKPYRIVAWVWLAVCGLLMASGTARAYYLGPAYPALLAAGGVVVERLGRSRRWAPGAVAGVLAAGGAVTAPLAIPLLPVETYITYQRALGLKAPQEEVGTAPTLDQHFADRFGWRELAQTVADVYAALPEAERAQAGIYVGNYGQAGAINFFGPALGLPRAISGHNNHWLWGPGDTAGEVMLVLAQDDAALHELFEDVTFAARIECTYCMPGEAAQSVYICRGLRGPFAEVWPRLKRYI